MISAAIEAEIMQLPEEERAEFIESLGLDEPGLHKGYSVLHQPIAGRITPI